MGFGDLDVTSIQKLTTLKGGAGMEFGCFSGSGSATTINVPTTFQTLIGGAIFGDEGNSGRAISICEGPYIDFTLEDATDATLFYIAFGWQFLTGGGFDSPLFIGVIYGNINR